MGNCFSADDSTPQTSTHPPPPEKVPGGVVSNNDYKGRSIASGDTSPLNSASMDPKLVSLLNFFKQLERRKKELFREVIPVHRDEILDAFKKIRKDEERIGRPGFQFVLKRSHSAGAVARGVDLSEGDLRLERFKVKTLDIGDPPPKNTTTTTTTGGGKGGGGKK